MNSDSRLKTESPVKGQALRRSIIGIEKYRDKLTKSSIADTLHRKRVFVNKYKVGKINKESEDLRELHSFLIRRSRRVCLEEQVPPANKVRLADMAETAGLADLSAETASPANKFYDFGGFSSDED